MVGDPQQQPQLAGDEAEQPDRVLAPVDQRVQLVQAAAMSAANTASVSSKMPWSAVWARNWPAKAGRSVPSAAHGHVQLGHGAGQLLQVLTDGVAQRGHRRLVGLAT